MTTSHVNLPAQAAPSTRLATRLAAVRGGYRGRRAVRAQLHRIECELASYTSPSDLAELDAMIERADIGSDSAYTEMIERIRLRAA